MGQKLPGVVMERQPTGDIYRAFNTTAQTPAAATLTYIAGSAIPAPVNGFKAGARLRWKFNLTKTAAGVAASTYAIVFGLLGTTADTARVSFTKPAGDATADEGIVEITAVVVSVNATTGVVLGDFMLTHGLAATGHAAIPNVVIKTTSGNFDNTSVDLIAGLVVTSGAADALTINWIETEMVPTGGIPS